MIFDGMILALTVLLAVDAALSIADRFKKH